MPTLYKSVNLRDVDVEIDLDPNEVAEAFEGNEEMLLGEISNSTIVQYLVGEIKCGAVTDLYVNELHKTINSRNPLSTAKMTPDEIESLLTVSRAFVAVAALDRGNSGQTLQEYANLIDKIVVRFS
jgi:hypothetical protein